MNPDERAALRRQLYERLERAEVGLVEAVRTMRTIAAMSQTEYARLVGVSPRVLANFERGVANLRLDTLERILAPFNLELTVRRRPKRDPALERLVLAELARSWERRPGRAMLPVDIAAGTRTGDGAALSEEEVRQVLPSLVEAGYVRGQAGGGVLLLAKGRARARPLGP